MLVMRTSTSHTPRRPTKKWNDRFLKLFHRGILRVCQAQLFSICRADFVHRLTSLTA